MTENLSDGCRLERDQETEAVYAISREDRPKLGEFLVKLSTTKGNLGITDYNMTSTTMDDVFLASERAFQGKPMEMEERIQYTLPRHLVVNIEGRPSKGQQFRGLFINVSPT